MSAAAGRPRDPSRDTVILEATLALLAERGVNGISMDAVAAAAGVSKPTIYRRWATKNELVAQALGRGRATDPPVADTGSLRGDLLALLHADAEQVTRNGGLILAMAFAVRSDPDLGSALATHVGAATSERAAEVLARAVSRGELPADLPPDPFFLRTMSTIPLGALVRGDDPADPQFLTRVVDELLLPALHRHA